MYYVYMLKTDKRRGYYKGFTLNLIDRLKEHNEGKVKSTKGYKPWKLVYYEAFVSKNDARREELFLKSGKGRERLKYLLSENL